MNCLNTLNRKGLWNWRIVFGVRLVLCDKGGNSMPIDFFPQRLNAYP
jgi:hypothetical protein